VSQEAAKPGGRPGRRRTSGSRTTAAVAEELGCRWLGIELHRQYAVLSVVRFVEDLTEEDTEGRMREMTEDAVGAQLGPFCCLAWMPVSAKSHTTKHAAGGHCGMADRSVHREYATPIAVPGCLSPLRLDRGSGILASTGLVGDGSCTG